MTFVYKFYSFHQHLEHVFPSFWYLDTYNCGFISEVKLQQYPEREPLLLEDLRILFQLCLSSLSSLCTSAAHWNQNGRGELSSTPWGLPSCFVSLNSLPLLSHQAAPTALTMPFLHLLGLVQFQFCDRTWSKSRNDFQIAVIFIS